MSEIEFDPESSAYMIEATQDIPRRCYEGINGAAFVLATTTVMAALQEQYLSVGYLKEAIGGAALYGVGVFADHVSTKRTLQVSEAALYNHGIVTGVHETSPIIGKGITSVEEYGQAIKSKRVLLGNIALAAPVLLFPFLGAGAGMARITAAFNNRRQRQRVERAIEISANAV